MEISRSNYLFTTGLSMGYIFHAQSHRTAKLKLHHAHLCAGKWVTEILLLTSSILHVHTQILT